MATAARELIETKPVVTADGGLTPVIIDGGDAVRIALVRLPAEAWVGARFTLDGGTFEIVRAKDHARGWVARPLPETAS